MAEPRPDATAPPAGWLLREHQDRLDVTAVLERFGQVYRYPVPDGPHLDPVAPGQRCVLVRTNRSRVVGLWAIGEVVAPVLRLPDDLDHPAAPVAGHGLAVDGRVAYLEVELLPFAKPLALDRLLGEGALADGALGRDLDGDDPDPWPLTRAEVRAIESQDFWIDAPDDAQRAELDRLLAAEEAADAG